MSERITTDFVLPTLGIITKPDKADPGSARELQLVEYAQNKHEQYRFQLGWHVVRNRGFNEEGLSLEELEQKQFGPDSIWKQHLQSEQLGINALRLRLSHVLENHIRESLPAVIRTIKNELDACQKRLKSIGEPRSTTIEQQAYLVPISGYFQDLVRQAVSGDVVESVSLTEPKTHNEQRNLRSFVECNNLHFADLMYERGHRWAIKNSEEYPEWPAVHGDAKHNFRDTPVPGEISAQEYLRKIQRLLEHNRGRHLRTLFEPRLMTCIFRDQSERWMIIAEAHIDNIFGAVAGLLKDYSKTVANEYTAKAIQEHLISDFLKKKRHELKLKLTEVLRPYRDLYPATYTRDFVADVQVRKERRNHTVAVNGLVHDLGAWKPKFSADSDAYKLSEHTLSILSKVPSTAPEFASTPTAILDLTYLYYKASLFKKLLRSSSDIIADCLEDLHRQCGRIGHRELSDIRSRQDILSGSSVNDGEERSEAPLCPCFGAHSHLPRTHETQGERGKADERPRNLLRQAGRLAHVFLDRWWTT